MPMSRRTVFFLLFALSGFTGLIYESIWTQYLKLFLGHAAYAQTLVLAIFMGGIALGSWICGRYSLRWKDLLLGYALAEGAIGLFALVFHPVFDQAVQFSFASIIPNLASPLAITLYKWTLSTLLILPQTVLLGMTFPLMTAGILRRYPDDPGRSVSTLYFLNSLGAALGVLASGFVLVRFVGLPGTIGIAGLINVGLSICVWLAVRGHAAASPFAGPVAQGDRPRSDGWYRLLLIASLITGAASFIYEIGWIRMLSLVLGSSTHAFELMLCAFILGLALGGLWVRGRIGSTADTVRMLVRVQIVMGACALVSLVLYGHTFGVMQWLITSLPKTGTGYVLFNLSSGIIALAIMFPTAFCAGMTLPLITTSLIRRGQGERSIGAVYAANTVGAIIGIFFAIHAGMPVLGLKGLMMTGAGLDIALGAALLWRTSLMTGSFRMPAAITAVCAGAFLMTGLFVELDTFKMGSGVYRYGKLIPREGNNRLVFHKDGKTATVSAFSDDGTLDVRTNGKPDASIQLDPGKERTPDEPTMILLAAIPLSLNPHASSVANIGFGSGLTTATFLQSGSITGIDTVEIEPAMVEAAKNFGPLVEAAYTDPRSRIHIDDAKTFFSAHNRKYDIIVSEPSNPWVSGVAGLFSEEFYRLIGRRLTADGVFCQWLHLYEMEPDLVVSVLKAVSSSFSNMVIYTSTDYDIILVAGNGRPIADPDGGVFHDPGIAASLNRVQIRTSDDLAIRRIGDKALFQDFLESFPTRANSDFYPVLDLNATRSRFLGLDSKEFIFMTYRPLPLAEMMAGTPLASGRTAVTPSPVSLKANASYIAMALRDIVLSDSARKRYAAVPSDLLDQAVKLKRLFFTDCSASSDERLAGLYETMALQMTPFLRPNELTALWKRLEAGTCMGSFSHRDRQWMALFKAVGARDASAMTKAATVLLAEEQGMPGGPQSYVVAAGMIGSLMQGDREGSIRLWKQYRTRLYGAGKPSLFFRLLAAQSAKR
jgi:spermidine synthase